MITAYLLRAIVIAGLIGFAASMIEFAFAAGRRPRRFVWLGALAASTVVPAVGMIAFERSVQSTSAQIGASPTPLPGGLRVESRGAAQSVMTGAAAPSRDAGRTGSTSVLATPAEWRVAVPAWLNGFDRPIAALWAALSLLWGAILGASAIRIHRNRGDWREAMLDGMPVYMSHDIGPALFGLTRFGIVVPSWVEGLSPERRRLIVAHEREHARAGDPVTLLAGALIVLIQPLNPAVWVMFRRLRLAIEIDCDARVLAHAGDVQTYGNLLIDVGERTLTGAAPIAALSEGGSQLEHRIAAMSRPTAQRTPLRVLGAVVMSVVVMAVAWNLPPLSAAAHPNPMPVADMRGASKEPRRAIVRVRDVGLHNTGPRVTVLVWAEGGPVRFATGTDSLRPLVDTVRLDRLPAMKFDVTDGHAFVALEGPGMLLLGAEVEGSGTKRLRAAGPRIVFLRGGTGVANGDTITPYAVDFGENLAPTVTDDVLWRLVEQRFPALIEGPLGAEPYVWLLVDAQDRLIASNRGLGDLPRSADGRLGSLQTSAVRRMLPTMYPRLRNGEAWGWRRLRTLSGDTIHVIWVRQLYDAVSPGPAARSDTVHGERAAARGDEARLAEATFLALFEDIVLSPRAAAGARGIILEQMYREFDYASHRGSLTNILAIQARRDTMLAAMLPGPAERTQFWRNAAARRAWVFRHSGEYRRLAEESKWRGGPP